jgi:thioester reductase-like protein
VAVLVTGYPNFMAQRLVRRELDARAGGRAGAAAAGTEGKVYVLVQEKHAARAAAQLRSHPAGARGEIVTGDVCILDLGLSGREVRALTAELTRIHHAAEVSYLGLAGSATREVNVGGTRMVLDLAEECTRLRRLVHYSTVFVSGARHGVILESELDEGQRFRNHWEGSKFEAELLVRRAMGRVPASVVRPGIVVGDSRSGEIGRLDGPYYLMALMVLAPTEAPVPLPGRGATPLNVVPIDFVERAAMIIAGDERGAGRTFHVTDPNPVSARRVFELVARSAGRAPPTGGLPIALSRLLMRVPIVERFVRSPRQFVDYFDHLALYSCRNTLELLDGTGVACPPFESYVDVLIGYVKDYLATRRRQRAATAAEPDEGREGGRKEGEVSS